MLTVPDSGTDEVLSEFDLIERYFTRECAGAILGVGDDAALVSPAAGMELAVSTDMLVSGRHFTADADPHKLGHKALAVNLSDMAAMGAKPRWATLSLALPDTIAHAHADWLRAFADGFFELAEAHQVALVGGDTTGGSLNICVTILGEVPQGKALRRGGARTGDDIWVSGQLGDAALALAHEQGHLALETGERALCLNALHAPTPRVALGEHLIGLAHSAIDISDGLLADLGHILACSNVGGVVRANEISCSAVMRRYLPQPLALKCLLAGGDDYELCFTAPVSAGAKIGMLSREAGISLTRIGRIVEGKGLLVLDAEDRVIDMERAGYDHFRP